MATVKLNVPESCEKEGCFLVNFTNGQLRPSAISRPRFSLYHKETKGPKKRKILVAETDQLTYVGTNFEGSVHSSAANLSKYYVGALDKETGVMTLHRAEYISLRPYIPGKTDTTIDEEDAPVQIEKAQMRDEMISLFGSEKQKRAYAAYKRNKVDTDVLESALASAVSQAESSQEATPALADSLLMQNSGLAPPHNPQAQTPQDVYHIKDILSMDDLRSVQKLAAVFTSATREEVTEWRRDKRYPSYVLQLVSHLPHTEPERSLKASFLLYTNWLMQMYTHAPRNFQLRGLQVIGVAPSPEVRQHMLEKFSEPGDIAKRTGKEKQRKLPRKMKDKILLHLFVLCLILDDFTVDCSALQLDLKLTTKKLMDNFKALGCHVSKLGVKRKAEDSFSGEASSCTASLQIPLQFPRRKQGQKGKR